jgi:hypothetical protein
MDHESEDAATAVDRLNSLQLIENDFDDPSLRRNSLIQACKLAGVENQLL